MDIDLDAGIKKIDVMIEEIKAFNYYSQGEFISFCQMKEVLEAMRTKISHICDKCANECKATHLKAECSLYTPKPSQGQDPCEETFETKQSDLNKIYGICVHPACRHKDAEIQLLNKELEITKKLLYIATGEVNNQADKNEKLKDRLAEAEKLLFEWQYMFAGLMPYRMGKHISTQDVERRTKEFLSGYKEEPIATKSKPHDTITIDRKVAQKFINAISQKQCSPLEIEVYKEFKRALGEKEDICTHNK